MKAKLNILKVNSNKFITVPEQQVHQNGFPCISDILSTYSGTGDISEALGTITFDVRIDNLLFSPSSFSEGDQIRLILQNGNSLNTKAIIKFLDIDDGDNPLEVEFRNNFGSETIPTDSINVNKYYILDYVAENLPTPAYFKITFVEGFNLSELLETNYIQLARSIDAVTSYVEIFTGRSIIDTDYKYELSNFPIQDEKYTIVNTDIYKFCAPSTNEYLPMTMPKRNIYNISKITYINTSDVETELDLDEFLIVTAGSYEEYTVIMPDTSLGFTLPTDVKDTTYPYAIYFSAGYEGNSVPNELIYAMKTHCAFLWANRGDMVNYNEIKEYKTLDKSDISKDIYMKYKYLGI